MRNTGLEEAQAGIKIAGSKAGNKGTECALAAIEMIQVLKQI